MPRLPRRVPVRSSTSEPGGAHPATATKSRLGDTPIANKRVMATFVMEAVSCKACARHASATEARKPRKTPLVPQCRAWFAHISLDGSERLAALALSRFGDTRHTGRRAGAPRPDRET